MTTTPKGRLGVAPADPSMWSEESQRSVAAGFITEYKDIPYSCWHCSTPAVFTAEDQKYTYEIKKANINQRRTLCPHCWEQSLRIARELGECENRWGTSKNLLSSDKTFLSHWLELLQQQETYVPYRPNTAKKNMLKKLLGNA